MKKMDEAEFLREFQDLLAIGSTTGQFREIHDYMVKKIQERVEFLPALEERANLL